MSLEAGVPSWQREPSHQPAAQADTSYVEWLTKRVQALQGALSDAIEGIESWAAYAGDYFREKHDLTGEIEALRAVLRDKEFPS